MKPKTIKTIQKVEKITQMQFCGRGYLDEGHSIYAAYYVDALDGLLYAGTYTTYDRDDYAGLPDDSLNGADMDEVAKVLLNLGHITQEDKEELEGL